MIDEATLSVTTFASLRQWREAAFWAAAFIGAAALMSALVWAQGDFQRFRIETAIAKMFADAQDAQAAPGAGGR